MRNFSLELKDTSEAEMQKFERFMLNAFTQVSDEKKASIALDKISTGLYGRIPIYKGNTFQNIKKKKLVVNKNILLRIIEWIRQNNGKNNVRLHKKSIQGLENVIDILQTFKGHKILCQIYQIEANVNLKKITFNTFVAGQHLLFVMSIHDINNKMVFRFQSESYYGILALVKAIGYSVGSFDSRMIEITRILFLNAHNHKDKVDVIYEKIPAFIIAKVRDSKSLKSDIDKLLGDYFSTSGTNEQKGVINILNTLKIKDSEKLYKWLYENSQKVLEMYKWFSGLEKDNFFSIILNLAQRYSQKPKSSEYAVLPDGYWFKNQILTTSVQGNFIEIKGFTSRVSNLESSLGLTADSMIPGSNTRASKYLKIKPQPGTDHFIREYITPVLMTPAFYKRPVELVNIRTVLSISDKETVLLESSLVALYVKYIDEEVSNATFWNAVNVASTLAGGYGAIRVITTKGAGWLLKSMAVAELTKASIDLVMLSDKAKAALIKAGLESLVQNWTIISITTDFAFLSFAGLYALAKYGKQGAKVLRAVDEAEQAAHLEKQAEKALEEIERRKKVKTPNKKAKFNPNQHSEFIDVESNLPGSKKSISNQSDDLSNALKYPDFQKIYVALSKGEIKRVYSNIFSIEEEAFIRFYQGEAYYKFNKALIENSISKEIISIEKQLNKTLDKIPNSTGSFSRGGGEDEVNKLLKIGKDGTIEYDNFLSTTTEKDVAWSFLERKSELERKAFITVKSKNGKNLEFSRSEVRGEFEILHKSKSKFKIESIDYKKEEILNIDDVAMEGATPIKIKNLYYVTIREL